DHVSMGANEARHVLAMVDDLGKVLALELYTAAQALDLRRRMIGAARDTARRADAATLAAKVQGAPAADAEAHAGFLGEVAALREAIPFLDRDRALDGEVAAAVRLVADGALLAAARGVVSG